MPGLITQFRKPTTTNAWQRGSTNPITQRVVPNGVPSKPSASSKGPPVPSKDSIATDKMPTNNLAFLAAQMRVRTFFTPLYSTFVWALNPWLKPEFLSKSIDVE
jgi:hypothetical protein